jgi:hypothetical protein
MSTEKSYFVILKPWVSFKYLEKQGVTILQRVDKSHINDRAKAEIIFVKNRHRAFWDALFDYRINRNKISTKSRLV